MIVERDHFPRFDQSKLRTRYDGEAVIWLDNVPYECEAGSLVCWVQAAMEAALPFLGKAKAKEEDLLEKFEVANAELMDCVKQPSKDEEEEHYKAVRVEALTGVAERARERHRRAKATYDGAVASLRAEPIEAVAVIRCVPHFPFYELAP